MLACGTARSKRNPDAIGGNYKEERGEMAIYRYNDITTYRGMDQWTKLFDRWEREKIGEVGAQIGCSG